MIFNPEMSYGNSVPLEKGILTPKTFEYKSLVSDATRILPPQTKYKIIEAVKENTRSAAWVYSQDFNYVYQTWFLDKIILSVWEEIA